MITLVARPSNAPCCVKVKSDNGQDMLVQTDWDFPGIASSFGWSIYRLQICPECKGVCNVAPECKRFGCHNCADLVSQGCTHSFTDGTIDCPECGITAGQFIQAARKFIDDNDGATADDPGYFAESGAQS